MSRSAVKRLVRAAVVCALPLALTQFGAAPQAAAAATTYIVTIHTGTASGAGTDADVYVNLLASRGIGQPLMESGYRFVDTAGYDDFENGDTHDYTIVTNEPLGTVNNLWVKYESSEQWQLGWVSVRDSAGTYYGRADCNCWLGGSVKGESFYLRP